MRQVKGFWRSVGGKLVFVKAHTRKGDKKEEEGKSNRPSPAGSEETKKKKKSSSAVRFMWNTEAEELTRQMADRMKDFVSKKKEWGDVKDDIKSTFEKMNKRAIELGLVPEGKDFLGLEENLKATEELYNKLKERKEKPPEEKKKPEPEKEKDLGKDYQVGDSVRVQSEYDKNRVFHGTITKINKDGTYEVDAFVQNMFHSDKINVKPEHMIEITKKATPSKDTNYEIGDVIDFVSRYDKSRTLRGEITNIQGDNIQVSGYFGNNPFEKGYTTASREDIQGIYSKKSDKEKDLEKKPPEEEKKCKRCGEYRFLNEKGLCPECASIKPKYLKDVWDYAEKQAEKYNSVKMGNKNLYGTLDIVDKDGEKYMTKTQGKS